MAQVFINNSLPNQQTGHPTASWLIRMERTHENAARPTHHSSTGISWFTPNFRIFPPAGTHQHVSPSISSHSPWLVHEPGSYYALSSDTLNVQQVDSVVQDRFSDCKTRPLQVTAQQSFLSLDSNQLIPPPAHSQASRDLLLPSHGIILGTVDTKDYEYVDSFELSQAEIIYDASSPASLHSPFTPQSDSELTFVDHGLHLTEISTNSSFSSASSSNGSSLYSPAYSPAYFSPNDSQILRDLQSQKFVIPLSRAAQPTDLMTPAVLRSQACTDDNGLCDSASATDRTVQSHLRSSYGAPQSSFSSSTASSAFSADVSSQPHPRFMGIHESADLVISDVDHDGDSTISGSLSDATSLGHLYAPNMVRNDNISPPNPPYQSSSVQSSSASESSREQGRGMSEGSKDEFLVNMRGKGLSYREIKLRGNFEEAESTLRGRYRMLTKEKCERVRRPEWTARDIHLLRHAVERFSGNRHNMRSSKSSPRLPWKRISEWIRGNGGSYLFAPATCARKWDMIVSRRG